MLKVDVWNESNIFWLTEVFSTECIIFIPSQFIFNTFKDRKHSYKSHLKAGLSYNRVFKKSTELLNQSETLLYYSNEFLMIKCYKCYYLIHLCILVPSKIYFSVVRKIKIKAINVLLDIRSFDCQFNMTVCSNISKNELSVHAFCRYGSNS